MQSPWEWVATTWAIFTPNSPMHDGAVLVSGDQIRCAGAILPLTQFAVSDRSLGTRHRAALGLSEETDAVVVVVSEETARVSVARSGRMERGVSPQRLREILEGALPEGRRSIVGGGDRPAR